MCLECWDCLGETPESRRGKRGNFTLEFLPCARFRVGFSAPFLCMWVTGYFHFSAALGGDSSFPAEKETPDFFFCCGDGFEFSLCRLLLLLKSPGIRIPPALHLQNSMGGLDGSRGRKRSSFSPKLRFWLIPRRFWEQGAFREPRFSSGMREQVPVCS